MPCTLGRLLRRSCSFLLASCLLNVGCGDTTSPTPDADPPRVPNTIAISAPRDTLRRIGETVQLTAEVRDQNGIVMAGAEVTWISDRPDVATVNASTGLVTAAAEGHAQVAASAGQIQAVHGITVDPPSIRVVYLVPADRTESVDYFGALEDMARHFRTWLHRELDSDRTITLSNPVVEVIRTEHDAEWYASTPAGDASVWFWNNVLSDAFALTGGTFNDPGNVWNLYIDADPACGQITGGTSGVAMFPANDLRGLVGEPNVPPCPGDPPDNAGVCRWIGGFGHELGHALGLPHPPGCDTGAPSCDANALMWLGFRNYPNTYLLPDEKTFLEMSPFLSTELSEVGLPGC